MCLTNIEGLHKDRQVFIGGIDQAWCELQMLHKLLSRI